MNLITLKGYIVGEPEIKVTPSGKTVVRFGLSVRARFRKDDQDSSKKHSSFFNCEYWPRDLGEGSIQKEIAKIAKGEYVVFDAEPIQERWTTDQGNRSTVRFHVDGFIDRLHHIGGTQKQEDPGF